MNSQREMMRLIHNN
jgi:hypothetical protein